MASRLLMSVGIAMFMVAAILLYESHELTNRSYGFINARTCIEALSKLAINPYNYSVVQYVMNRYPISVQVIVAGINGTQLAKYGYYVPITPQTPGGVLPPSGNVVVLGPGACMEVGGNYTITVRLGLWPAALYVGLAGLALLICGFVALIIADRVGDEQAEAED